MTLSDLQTHSVVSAGRLVVIFGRFLDQLDALEAGADRSGAFHVRWLRLVLHVQSVKIPL